MSDITNVRPPASVDKLRDQGVFLMTVCRSTVSRILRQ